MKWLCFLRQCWRELDIDRRAAKQLRSDDRLAAMERK